MEVDLSSMWRQGKAAAIVGVVELVAPFVVGFVAAWYAPWSMG